jgi:hypothetical protein
MILPSLMKQLPCHNLLLTNLRKVFHDEMLYAAPRKPCPLRVNLGKQTLVRASRVDGATGGPSCPLSRSSADDPRGVARQIDSRFGELLRQLEAEQRGLLSD